MRLFQPVIGNSQSTDQPGEAEIGDWPSSVLACIWNFLLIIYIPVNELTVKIKNAIDLEYLSGKKIARIFKIMVLGFFMMGFLFLVHDLLWMLYYRKSETSKAVQHRRFHMAISLAFLTAIAFTMVSVFLFAKEY